MVANTRTSPPRALGVLGGSFDPVHKAHVILAAEVLKQLTLDDVYFLPCHVPPHKSRLHASAQHRVAMLELAIEAFAATDGPTAKGLHIDTRELQREGPSYTRDTLEELREELRQLYGSETSLNFIIGWDSWMNFSAWYQWREILNFANLVLLRRPGFNAALPSEVANLWQQHGVEKSQLRHFSAGKIAEVETQQYELASSDIRQRIARGKDTSPQLYANVQSYIAQHGLYLHRP